MNHIANPRKMVSSKMEHATDATVKCQHCKKECDPETPEAEFICWHGLCAECELKGVIDGLNRRQ